MRYVITATGVTAQDRESRGWSYHQKRTSFQWLISDDPDLTAIQRMMCMVTAATIEDFQLQAVTVIEEPTNES